MVIWHHFCMRHGKIPGRHRDIYAHPSHRFFMTPAQAVCIILILVTGLCASLTLLIIQSSSIRSLQQAVGIAASDRSRGTGRHQDHQEKDGDVAQHGTGDSGNTGSAAGQAEESEQSRTLQQEAERKGGAAGMSGQPSQGAGLSGNGGNPGSSGKQDMRININSASEEQLETVKGIGPSTAKKIIAYRTSHGRFTSVDELLNVAGIGAKTLAKIRGSISVSG